MEKQFKYNLQKGSTKIICPQCGKKTFVRYINNVTGECCPPQYGRCDREMKCGFINYPKFEKDQAFKSYKVIAPKPKPQPLTPIPFEVLAETLNNYEQNVFIQNLLGRVAFPFEPCDIEAVIAQYYLGTVTSWGGAVAFPFIDIQNNIRAIQVKQFNEANHTTKTSFLHSTLKFNYLQRGDRLPDWLPAYELNDTKVSCLFGEHLLSKHPLNPVALVEAPKGAIYGTLYFGLPSIPERFLWLAVYNLSSLNIEKCKALQGRDVVLFPDLSTDGKAFQLWNSKLKQLNTIKGARFRISDLLERKASETERANGCDIADYLICQDWRLFRESEKCKKSEDENKLIFHPPQININAEPIQAKTIQLSKESTVHAKDFTIDFFDLMELENLEFGNYTPAVEFVPNIRKPKENWNNEICDLETYFSTVKLQTKPIQFNSYTKIIDVRLFVESHLSTLRANNGISIIKPHLTRLQELRRILDIDSFTNKYET